MTKRLLTRREAAGQMSMSLTHWEQHVQPHLRIVRSGRLRLVPQSEIDRWINEQARFPG